MKLKILIILGLFTGFTFNSNSQDTVLFDNGVKIIGSIEELKQGNLVIDSDFGNKDLELEWDKVKSVNSETSLIVVLTNGERLYGKLKSDSSANYTYVKGSDFSVQVKILDIVYLKPLSPKFKDKFDIYLSGGYTLTKSNSTQQITLIGKVSYLTKDIYFETNSNVLPTFIEGVSPTRRAEVNNSFK